MGWLFTQGASRADIIQRRTREWENDEAKGRTLAKKCAGNVLWTVREYTIKATGETKKYIGCDLLSRHGAYGWGYKDMDESMGPCYYTCPLSFFKMVPDPGGYATEWRKKVVEDQERRNQRLHVGQVVFLHGCSVDKVIITSVRPLRGRDESGKLWRIPRRFLPAKEAVNE